MTKYSYSLLVCCVSAVQRVAKSIEQLSIDYMLPQKSAFRPPSGA